MRDHPLTRFFIKIIQFVILEVEVSAISQAPKLSSAAKWVIKYKIDGSLRIMRPVILWNIFLLNFLYAQVARKLMHFFPPHFKILFPIFLFYKVLYLHLFKLARTEYEIAWRDFVPEGLAYLSHAKGQARMM